jgi:hypothetical protein
MKVGFTGTRKGMTPQQRVAFAELVITLRPTQAHHGDCVGADAEFHHGCKALVNPRRSLFTRPLTTRIAPSVGAMTRLFPRFCASRRPTSPAIGTS